MDQSLLLSVNGAGSGLHFKESNIHQEADHLDYLKKTRRFSPLAYAYIRVLMRTGGAFSLGLKTGAVLYSGLENAYFSSEQEFRKNSIRCIDFLCERGMVQQAFFTEDEQSHSVYCLTPEMVEAVNRWNISKDKAVYFPELLLMEQLASLSATQVCLGLLEYRRTDLSSLEKTDIVAGPGQIRNDGTHYVVDGEISVPVTIWRIPFFPYIFRVCSLRSGMEFALPSILEAATLGLLPEERVLFVCESTAEMRKWHSMFLNHIPLDHAERILYTYDSAFRAIGRGEGLKGFGAHLYQGREGTDGNTVLLRYRF